MDIRGVLKTVSNERFICLPCFFTVGFIQVNVHTSRQVQVTINILLGYQGLESFYVRDLEICDLSTGIKAVSFDMLGDISVQIRTQMAACTSYQCSNFRSN